MTTMSNTVAGPARPPAPVRIAVAAVVTGVVLHVVALVLNLLAASPRAVERAARQRLGSTGSNPDLLRSLTTIGVAAAIVSTGVICALGVLFAVAMYRGRNWGRITLTVFAALELVSVLVFVVLAAFGRPFPGATSPVLDATVRVVTGVLALVFLVCAYQRPASDFLVVPRAAPAGPAPTA